MYFCIETINCTKNEVNELLMVLKKQWESSIIDTKIATETDMDLDLFEQFITEYNEKNKTNFFIQKCEHCKVLEGEGEFNTYQGEKYCDNCIEQIQY